jgi:hypothetical protein
MRGRYGTDEREFRHWNMTMMAKAWIRGAGLVLAVYLAWFALLAMHVFTDWVSPLTTLMMLVALNVPGLAALLTALRAPRHRFLLGLTMAPVAAACAVAMNLALAAFGVRVDLSGFYDNSGLFLASTGYGAFVAVLGGVAGAWVGARNAAEVSVAVRDAIDLESPGQ